MSYDSVTNIRVPLTFTLGDYTVQRVGQFITVDWQAPPTSDDGSAGMMSGMPSVRDWHFGDEHAAISVMTDDEHSIMHLRLVVDPAAATTAATTEGTSRSTAVVEMLSQSLTTGASVDATWTTTLRTSDGAWTAHATTGITPIRRMKLSRELSIGMDENDTLVSLTVFGTDVVSEPRRFTITPEQLRVSGQEANGTVHVSIHAEFENQMLEWHEDPVLVAETAAYQAQVDAWLAGEADEPKPPAFDAHASSEEPESVFASPDGVLTLYDYNGAIATIELQAVRGVVDLPDEPAQSASSETIMIDLSAGVTCMWQPGASTGSYDVSVTCGDRVADRWFGTDEFRCGIAGDELAAIVMTGVRSFDMHHEMHSDMWAADPIGRMERLADPARFAAIDPAPTFASIGLCDWDGPVYGGPTPDDGSPGRIMMNYGDIRDQAGPQLEIAMQTDLSPYPVFDDFGIQADAMTLARYLMSERMRDVTSDDEAQQLFAQMNELAADIATQEWQKATLDIDGEQVAARTIDVDQAWVAKLKYHETQITITAWKVPRESAIFTRLDSFAPFIEGSRQFMMHNLELSRQAFAEHPEMFPSNIGPFVEISSLAARFFEAMSCDAPAVCNMLADGIVGRHGGRSTYIRLLRLYQAVTFGGGGGYNQDVRISDDGGRASMPVHFDLPTDDEATRGASMMVSTGSEPRPQYQEQSDDDVQLSGDQLNVTLRFERATDEWKVATDILAALIDVCGPPAEAVRPR